MSYKYRKEKRNLAALILSRIRSEIYDDPTADDSDWEKIGHSADKLRSELPSYSYEQINSAVQLLKFNKHVTFFELGDPSSGQGDPLIIPTRAGIEASFEGFYEKENQKDRLECFELRTRWILPIASIIFSFTALALSILSYYYPRK